MLSMLIGIGFSHADNVQTLDKLQAENQALLLKLEAYSLKKKIIEMQNFIANDKLQKERKIERDKALVQLRKDLRASRRNVRDVRLAYKR